jgi:hypothetical protein
MMFLGNGQHSIDLRNSLRKQFEEAVDMLGWNQQPPHSESEEEATRHREEYERERFRIEEHVRDIAMALTGKEITFLK